MRRLPTSRTQTAVAVVVTIVAAVALLPGVGFGESPVFQGGSPTNVYTTKDPGLCPQDRIPLYPGTQFPTMRFSVRQPSTLVVDWTMKWGWGRTPIGGADLYIVMWLQGDNGYEDNSPTDGFTWHSTPDHDTATVMWPFVEVPAGEYEIQIGAIDLRTSLDELNPERSGGGVTLQGCAMTVSVIPTA